MSMPERVSEQWMKQFKAAAQRIQEKDDDEGARWIAEVMRRFESCEEAIHDDAFVACGVNIASIQATGPRNPLVNIMAQAALITAAMTNAYHEGVEAGLKASQKKFVLKSEEVE